MSAAPMEMRVAALLLALARGAHCELPIAATVFKNGDANISCFRIPAVVQTESGVLVAFAEARHGSCADNNVHEIAARRSLDGGFTWSKLTFVAGSSAVHAGNPSVTFDRKRKRIVLICKLFEAAPDFGVVFSEDDGQTWSDVRRVDFGQAVGSSPGPGTAIQTASGRLLVPSHHGPYKHDLVTLSDDGGHIWKTIKQTFPGMDEAVLTQLPNGSLLINMRHEKERELGRAFAVSDDDGNTFGAIQFDSALHGPVCQASMVSFGGATYFSNPSGRVRDHLLIRKSVDNARTWPDEVLVTTLPSFGYSCLVQAALLKGYNFPGEMARSEGGILFEAPGSVIQFARFPLVMPQSRLSDKGVQVHGSIIVE
eukprot:6201009-Pleurochrysis_carterae.AAC.2